MKEPTFGIFSHTRPIAKDFLKQIKVELETNDLLKDVFPDILYEDPQTQSPKWSEDGGLVVKRKSNPKESTLEAHGLVDGQPTGKHFTVRIYDDVVTEKAVTTPDMIKKVNDQWGLSLNLGVEGGIERYVGTRYRYNDTYSKIMEGVPVRKYAATDDGTADGKPVFRSQAWVDDKKRAGSYTFGCQQLLDPIADSLMSFSEEHLNYYEIEPSNNDTNNYILCDPANEKKKESDYTSFWVLGLAEDQNFYVKYLLRDRLSLTERWDVLLELHQTYRPLGVAYEKYGMQADIDHFKDRMEKIGYRFVITPVGGNTMMKNDRVLRLLPYFEQDRIWLPKRQVQLLKDGTTKDMVSTFVNDEYLAFPVGIHPDMLDSLSRIVDIPHTFPSKKTFIKPKFRRAV
jgi:phage terminase large subunit-like protein